MDLFFSTVHCVHFYRLGLLITPLFVVSWSCLVCVPVFSRPFLDGCSQASKTAFVVMQPVPCEETWVSCVYVEECGIHGFDVVVEFSYFGSRHLVVCRDFTETYGGAWIFFSSLILQGVQLGFDLY